MTENFNDRTPIPIGKDDDARAYRAQFTDERPKCQVCGDDIEIFLDLRREFPNANLYWAHAFGVIPQHKAQADDGIGEETE